MLKLCKIKVRNHEDSLTYISILKLSHEGSLNKAAFI